jgi:hypothetical protein
MSSAGKERRFGGTRAARPDAFLVRVLKIPKIFPTAQKSL